MCAGHGGEKRNESGMEPALRKPPSTGVAERGGGGNTLIIWVKPISAMAEG